MSLAGWSLGARAAGWTQLSRFVELRASFEVFEKLRPCLWPTAWSVVEKRWISSTPWMIVGSFPSRHGPKRKKRTTKEPEGTTTLRQVDQEIDRSRLVNVLCAAERVQNLDELGNSWQFMAIHHSSDEDRQSQVIFNETHLNSHEIYDALTALSTCFNIMD